MELPYTIFALGDAQLHQLHTEAGKVRGFRSAFPHRSLSQIERRVCVGTEKDGRVHLYGFPVWF